MMTKQASLKRSSATVPNLPCTCIQVDEANIPGCLR